MERYRICLTISSQKTVNFVKETVIFDSWGPVYKNWGPHLPPQLYAVQFCSGQVLYIRQYNGTSVARRTRHHGQGLTGIQKSNKSKRVYSMFGEA